MVWIPADEAGVAEDVVRGVRGLYGIGAGIEDGEDGGKGKGMVQIESEGEGGDNRGQRVEGEKLEESGTETEKMVKLEKAKDEGGPWLMYSCSGAHLTKKGNVQITQPAPDVRADWCLEWQL